MALLLVGQLLDQAIALLSPGVALGFLGAKGGLAPPNCSLRLALASADMVKKKKAIRKKSPGKIRPDCSAVSPNLEDYTQWVR